MIYGNATDFDSNAMAMPQKFIASKVKKRKDIYLKLLHYYE